MPRRRNGNLGQPNGQPTQPINTPTGLPYGQNQQLQQSQAAVPLPQLPPPPSPPGPGGGGPPGGPPPDPHAGAMAAAAAMPGVEGLLGGPTQRPHEPVTSGLSLGLGPGPEILGQRPTTQAAFRSLADQTSDADIAYLADIVGQLGI